MKGKSENLVKNIVNNVFMEYTKNRFISDEEVTEIQSLLLNEFDLALNKDTIDEQGVVWDLRFYE